ncbi:MAG TPA: DUF4199 domain-containing protein [Bacteroidales bacterium]|nr:DUF4199 domain-containing protein [Bacteroidales bacterium]
MNNWIKNMLYPSLIYTGIIGGIYILNNLVVDAFNLPFSIYNQVSANLILIAGIVIAIYAYRKEYNNNLISYGRAVGFGALTALLVGIILSIYTNIYIQYINPDFVALLKQNLEEKFLQKGFSPDMIETITSRTDRMQKPLIVFARTIFSTEVLGVIVSLIASIFIKKEPSEPFADVA